MQSPIKRLIEPLFIKVDFTDRYWDINPTQARAWLLGAIFVDLTVQALVGLPNWLTVFASLLTAVIFWTVPPRLSGAVGGLYIAQALGSFIVVTAAAMTESRLVVEGAALLWWAWCMFALVQLILAYIRTPKQQFGPAPKRDFDWAQLWTRVKHFCAGHVVHLLAALYISNIPLAAIFGSKSDVLAAFFVPVWGFITFLYWL